ncbi:hypothetical protein K474DRAFT_1664761 [Panus rudis PR-1116 ss-1]|nr:hypothetical protein K474DRAFT_1664761 [Panus rudis PR-1116 ss-1]
MDVRRFASHLGSRTWSSPSRQKTSRTTRLSKRLNSGPFTRRGVFVVSAIFDRDSSPCAARAPRPSESRRRSLNHRHDSTITRRIAPPLERDSSDPDSLLLISRLSTTIS